MPKFKLIKRYIPYALAMGISLSNPLQVKADTFFGKSTEEWETTFKKIGKKAVEKASEAEDFVNEKMMKPIEEKGSKMELFEPESLWLITDIPEKNPEEERDYYFVINKIPTMKWTFFYDNQGNKVSRNSKDLAKTEIRELYTYLADTDKTFRVETWLDRETGQFTVNYVDFNVDSFYDPLTRSEYGRIVDWESLIPESSRQEKYSDTDLKAILENYLNNLNYSLEGPNLARKK